MIRYKNAIQPNQSNSIIGTCIAIVGLQYLSYLFEGLEFDVGEDIALGHGEDLEGHCTVVVLQGRDIVIAHSQLCPSVNLIPGHREKYKQCKKKKKKTSNEDYDCCGTE